MRISKQTLLYVCFLLAFVVSTASAESLSELKKKCEEARSLSQYDKLETISAQFVLEAKRMKDNANISYAYFYNGLAKLFLGNASEADSLFNIADDILLKTKNDTVKALIFNARGISEAMIENNNFVAQTFFFKSLELAKSVNYEELQLRVLGNLLTLSHSIGDSIALENASEVYEYGVAHKNHEQIYMGAYYLATYYYNKEKYAEAEKYLDITIDLYDKQPYDDIASVYALYAKLLLNKGDIEAAKAKAEQALTYAQTYHQPSMEVDVYITMAEVMAKKRNHQEAINMIHNAMNVAEEIGMNSKSADCYRILAENYLALGNMTEGLKCLQITNSLLEEKATLNMERLAHEQRIMHDIEQKEMEEKVRLQEISSQQRLLVISGIAIIILIVLLAIIIIDYRRRQILYKKIVLQNSRAVIQQKLLMEQIEEMKQGEEEADGGEASEEKKKAGIDEEKINQLYKRLCWLMDHERLYAESQLTRDRMAERLDTNRTYLTAAIKMKTGMNYLQFINSYRINEAIRILSDKEKQDYPLKQIWSDLGFSSPSTFYKLFQQAVGITPSTFRKQILEVNENEEIYPADED